MANLNVAYEGVMINGFSGSNTVRYSRSATGFDGELLYRTRLTAPLDSLELIFSIKHLPAGAGAGVLGWVTLVLLLVFLGGFTAVYRVGLSQINLARQQQDFVASVSHELKTPLTSIRMYGEILKEGWADEEKRQRYYEFIHDESERLSRLISNVLQLARISRNEPQFDMQQVAVAELMSNTESKISSQVERAGFELRFIQDESVNDATITIDEDCFTQIIINLVDNAIKFSKDAAEKAVEVRCKRVANDQIVFSVRDFGPGVPRDQMKKIFELFYRSESELTRETVGTGIGLAIVYQLTTAMGGSVDLVNVDPGAEFRVTYQAMP
jgi:signal transduction histidine kinase